MNWGVLVPAIVAALSAVYGVGYGAKLAGKRETQNWTREQRLKVYAELLYASEQCYEAFTLMAAQLSLANYDIANLSKEQLVATRTEWSRAYGEMDRHLGRAELVASDKLWPYLVGGMRHGIRTHHQFVLMQLSVGVVDQKEWERLGSFTHGELLKLPRLLRDDMQCTGDGRYKITGTAARRLVRRLWTSGRAAPSQSR